MSDKPPHAMTVLVDVAKHIVTVDVGVLALIATFLERSEDVAGRMTLVLGAGCLAFSAGFAVVTLGLVTIARAEGANTMPWSIMWLFFCSLFSIFLGVVLLSIYIAFEMMRPWT